MAAHTVDSKVVHLRLGDGTKQATAPGAAPEGWRVRLAAVITVAAIVGFLLRVPFVSSGLPYFYNEDEAHHFNRTVDMVKRGDFNPHYFHKPSLHFYLRMPIVAAAFLGEVRRGTLREIDEIQTRDAAGIAGYNFTASHPGVVKLNRALSVFMGLLTIVLASLTGWRATGRLFVAAFAAGLFAVSPEAIRESAVIGVDPPTALFCVLSVFLALGRGRWSIALSAITAGLAVSTKYNALPIMVVPLIAALRAGRQMGPQVVASLVLPWVGFLLGSPFILAEIPLFLNQLAYEIWHYGIAGHVGHTAEPGLEQAAFYTDWLGTSAVGWAALATTLLGLAALCRRPSLSGLTIAAFPICFFVLMSEQRANFTRNMLPFLPFVGILAGIGIAAFADAFAARHRSAIAWTLGALVLVQPSISALAAYREPSSIVESRASAEAWLRQHAPSSSGETVVASALQMPPNLMREPGYLKQAEVSPDDLLLDGYARIVTMSPLGSTPLTKVVPELEIPGTPPDRVLANPPIFVSRLEPASEPPSFAYTPSFKEERFGLTFKATPSDPDRFGCDSTPGEDYCWTSARYMRLAIVAEKKKTPELAPLRFEVMSPWTEQRGWLRASDGTLITSLGQFEPGVWHEVVTQAAKLEDGFLIETAAIRSPKTLKAGNDGRRLGIAIRGLRVNGK